MKHCLRMRIILDGTGRSFRVEVKRHAGMVSNNRERGANLFDGESETCCHDRHEEENDDLDELDEDYRLQSNKKRLVEKITIGDATDTLQD